MMSGLRAHAMTWRHSCIEQGDDVVSAVVEASLRVLKQEGKRN